MIESILINNFRGIQTGQIDGFRKFNLLVGPNNSGKSALLEALYLAATANRKARLTEQPTASSYDGRVSERDFLGDDPMARVLARHNYPGLPSSLSDRQRELRININSPSAPLQTFDLSLKVRLTKDEPYPLGLFSFKAGNSVSPEEKAREQEYFGLARKLAGKDVQSLRGGQVTYCWATDLTYYQNGSAVWVVEDQESLSRQTLFYDVSSTLSHLPMSFFRKMIVTVPGWSQKIARGFGQVIGLDEPFNVQFLPTDQEQKWMQGWIAPENQIALTVDSYGDGARTVFKVLTPLLALAEGRKPGLFVWEEPELFQNPQTLNRLLTEIALLLKGKPVQVFIATHSLEVVANFVHLVQEGRIAEDEMAAIRLNLVNGKLSSSIFDHRNIQAWTEMHLDLRVPSGKIDIPLTYQLPETVNAADYD